MNTALSIVLFIIVLGMAIALLAKSACFVYAAFFLLRRSPAINMKDIYYGFLSIIFSILFLAGGILLAIASFHLVIL